MTLFFAVGGVDVGNDKVRLEGGIASLTAYANGSVATAGVEVDDPTGVLTFIDLQTFTVIETACTAAPRCFTGYIYNLRVKRGPFRNGAGRVWVFDVGDLNFLLHLRVLRGADAKRPRETIDARVAWLLGSAGMTGVVFDNGMVASRGSSMIDEADYRHQYHDEVWQDISTGWIFFVYWNGTQPSMFFDDPTAVTNTSTLTISNVLSDVVANPTTCFAPNEDSELLGAGEDIYDGVDYTYIGDANIYRQRAATFTDFGLHRDGTVVSSRVGLLATAELQAASFLELHSGQIDTITCVVQLPASKVNLIDAGMRISVRFSHLPGYTSFTYTRVTSRTVTLAAGTNEYYDVQLELSMKGIGQLGGGAPGDFPHAGCTPTTGTFVQKNTGTSLISGTYYAVMAAPTTVGNTLIRYAPKRNVPTGPAETGIDPAWILTPPGVFVTQTSGAKVWYRPVTVAETNVHIQPDLNSNDVVIELEGPLTLVDSASANDTTTHVICASVTPTAGSNAVILGIVNGYISPGTATNNNYTPDSGWTELFDDSDGAGAPNSTIVYKHVASASGSYAPSTVMAFPSTFVWNAQSLAFVCAAADNPPSPAQEVPWTTVTVSTVGGVSTGTTAFPYADGSLKVKVDGVLISPASYVESDPATGAFSLTWIVDADETVTVTYLGR